MLERRHFPHTRAQHITFDELLPRYRTSVLLEASPVGRATAERHLAWWREHLGTLPLADITADRIAEARDILAAQACPRGRRNEAVLTKASPTASGTRSGATINRYMSTLSHLLSTAVTQWRLIDKNPVHDIARKKESRGRVRFLGNDERVALLQACATSAWPPLQALVLLAISTGARRGELIRLRWADVTLESSSPQAIIHDTKNGDARRLPLVGRALEAMRRLQLSNQGSSPLVFPSLKHPDRPYYAFDAHWYAALSRAGLSDFRFHDLRHTCASYLASQGASLLEIADVLGHRTMNMVKRYSHLAQNHKVAVIKRMVRTRGL
jgi:integrase